MITPHRKSESTRPPFAGVVCTHRRHLSKRRSLRAARRKSSPGRSLRAHQRRQAHAHKRIAFQRTRKFTCLHACCPTRQLPSGTTVDGRQLELRALAVFTFSPSVLGEKWSFSTVSRRATTRRLKTGWTVQNYTTPGSRHAWANCRSEAQHLVAADEAAKRPLSKRVAGSNPPESS